MLNEIKFRRYSFLAIMVLMILVSDVYCHAQIYTTGDGLSINVNSSGRTDSLVLDGRTILFPGSETAGFYIRDNTIDPQTGLPGGVTNLLLCPGFQDDFGDECLTSNWTITRPDPWEDTEITAREPLPDSGNFVAQVSIDEWPQSGPAHWAILSQDVALAATDTNDLYYLAFEVATESGWRPRTHPDNWEKNKHGDHKVFGRVEWFGGATPPLEITTEHSDLALAVSTLDAYETSLFTEPDGLTRFCLRTHRPVVPTLATHARISLVVKGFLPDDGTGPDEMNHVWFDNVYFFKAPAAVQVTGYGKGEDNFQPLPGLDHLSMWADISVAGGPSGSHYIHFTGAIRNDYDTGQGDPDIPRAVDIGYALPIWDNDGTQDVHWWNDARNAENISVETAEGRLTNWVPYRLTGPIDQRASSEILIRTEVFPTRVFKEFDRRAGNNQISAYPLSDIDVEFQDGERRGVSFGEYLGEADEPADPQILHFGYHIERPSDTDFLGKYYAQFNLAPLKPSSGQTVTPFSFIFFRSDNPATSEDSSFREGVEKYQTTFFPFAFTRPTHLPPDDEWLFGGGLFKPEWNEDALPDPTWWETGFTKDPSDFGLRYAFHVANQAAESFIAYGDTRDVRILIYDRPWSADFINNETGDSRNLYGKLQEERDDGTGYPLALYEAKKDHQLKLPNVCGVEADLFGRLIKNDPTSSTDAYLFPVLLADFDHPTNSIIDAEMNYYTNGYGNSAGYPYAEGFAGIMYDVAFNDMSNANHLDQAEARLPDYSSSGGVPTYSFNNFMPAIPQLIPNVRFLDLADTLLGETIDNPEFAGTYKYGEGSSAGENTTEELVTGNIIQRDFGGNKYAMMKVDVAGFESNAATSFNRSEESLSHRRAMMREKSMARLLHEFPCLVLGPNWDSGVLPEFGDLPWAGSLFIDIDQLRIQLVNEVSWTSLAWGFLPVIHKYLPYWLTEETYYTFVDKDLRPLFTNDIPGTEPKLGYAEIFRELHLAGWAPVTDVEVDLAGSGEDIDDLYWERFGGWGDAGPKNLTYVTVLNNRDLQFTLVELLENKVFGITPLSEIEDEQQLTDLEVCQNLLISPDLPSDCSEVDFRARDKDIWVTIQDPIEMGLWANNIHCAQLVGYEPPDPAPCNTPEIVAAFIEEGHTTDPFSIARYVSPDGPVVRIGGPWLLGGQQSFKLPDKALMVFRLYSTDIAGNGKIGGDEGRGDSTGGGTSGEDSLVTAYYERYGQGWTRTEDPAGHEGCVDAVLAASPDTTAYFKIHAGLSGSYQVRVHFPPSTQATASAIYEVFLTDYLPDPAGSSSLGEPVLTAMVDQSDTASYAAARDIDGFVPIGDLEISLDEGREVATVVVKLSSQGQNNDRTGGPPALLLADAVRLARIE